MSSLSVNVSLETSDEYQIQEINYDGQEKYIQQLSMSENLTKLAHKIEFGKIDDEMDTDAADDANEDKEKEMSSNWPWEAVRTKLQSALTEISVLCDVIAIAKEKKFLVLDPVSQEPLDFKPITALVAKKKALFACGQILQNGLATLANSQEQNRPKFIDFHTELMTVRQHWRIRKVGNSILGDLSYRSAGSRFNNPGTFEITKTTQTSTSIASNLPSPLQSSLKVTIPSDLEGVSYIHVSIQKDNDTLASGNLSIPIPQNSNTSTDGNWQQKLESAQNVLFCKELFAQLAQEAVQVQFPVPTLVIGNQIIATLFPGVQLSIGSCHTNPSLKKPKEEPQIKKQNTGTNQVSRSEHKPVLEHSLHQLLRELHYQALHQPMPHPVTAALGISRKKYFAGPEAYDRHVLIESSKSETILEQIIAQSQHVILRLRTMCMIDTLASDIKDPLIVAHCLSLNSPNKSSVKINIVTYGYESQCRTPLVIHVGTKSLKAICRDGRTFKMSYESQELRYLIMSQVSQHQINAVQALAKLMGWKVLSYSINSGVGPIEMLGTASSLILASPNGDRMLAIRHGPQSGAHVSISLSPHEQDFYPSALVRERKWQSLSENFKEVAWEKIEGKNLVQKMEYLMAALTNF